jgi:hypothetical protein
MPSDQSFFGFIAAEIIHTRVGAGAVYLGWRFLRLGDRSSSGSGCTKGRG